GVEHRGRHTRPRRRPQAARPVAEPKRSLCHPRPLHGFTLVELLVVVSIIALLLAVLLPALGKAKRAAKLTVCTSQLHQIGLAFVMYSQDNNNIPPAAWTEGKPWFQRLWLSNLLMPHSGSTATALWDQWNTKVADPIKCPAVFQYPSDTVPAWWGYNSSYAYNTRWAAGSLHPWDYSGFFRLTELTRPSDLLALTDQNVMGFPAVAASAPLAYSNVDRYVDFARHGNVAGWLAWDSHVSTVQSADMPGVFSAGATADSAWMMQHVWKN
ncbi:MAG: type II secretion system protein, partial [Phycisphaerales bacterium]